MRPESRKKLNERYQDFPKEGYMDQLPSLDKKKIEVSSLNDVEDEKRYWLAKNPDERIKAIEINRRMVYGQDRTTSRLQRFLEIAELS